MQFHPLVNDIAVFPVICPRQPQRRTKINKRQNSGHFLDCPSEFGTKICFWERLRLNTQNDLIFLSRCPLQKHSVFSSSDNLSDFVFKLIRKNMSVIENKLGTYS